MQIWCYHILTFIFRLWHEAIREVPYQLLDWIEKQHMSYLLDNETRPLQETGWHIPKWQSWGFYLLENRSLIFLTLVPSCILKTLWINWCVNQADQSPPINGKLLNLLVRKNAEWSWYSTISDVKGTSYSRSEICWNKCKIFVSQFKLPRKTVIATHGLKSFEVSIDWFEAMLTQRSKLTSMNLRQKIDWSICPEA